MQRKTVRFTSQNEFYSPIHSPAHTPTRTPSPPPEQPSHPTSLFSDSPPQQPPSFPSIHPFLKVNGGHRYMMDYSNFNLSVDPNTAFPMSNPIFQQPVVTPSLASITLICETLPWEIVILPKPDASLVIADIFHGLYRNLRQAVLHEEYKIESAQRRSAVDRALDARRRCLGEDPEDVRRRVDFLTLQHRFLGLSPTRKADVWKLHVSL